MLDYASILLYVLTFLLGIFLDNNRDKNAIKYRQYYVLWLYVFLCFGYMTGADWRGYERSFEDWNRIYERDYGYVYTINFVHHFINDFWVVFAVFKCFYLWSCIRLLKILVPYWLSSLAIMIPTTLLFMLVDSPFRFTMAMTFVNFAFFSALKQSYVKAVIFALLSVLFHSSSLFVIILIPFIKYHPFVRAKKVLLTLVYLFFVILSYNLNAIEDIQLLINLFLRNYEMRSFEAYNVEEVPSFFTVGIMLHFIFFLSILYTKERMLKVIPNSEVIINMAILSCLVWRAVSVMPTASRVVHPFLLFYSIYFVYLIKEYKPLKHVLLSYFVIVMTKSLLDSFVYIPYSNSIPYIISGHLPYQERYNYNLKAYQIRTGKKIYLLDDGK